MKRGEAHRQQWCRNWAINLRRRAGQNDWRQREKIRFSLSVRIGHRFDREYRSPTEAWWWQKPIMHGLRWLPMQRGKRWKGTPEGKDGRLLGGWA